MKTLPQRRIFVKTMVQEVTESMGPVTVNERFGDPEVKALCTGMFPLNNPKKYAVLYELLYEYRTWCPY